MCAIGKENAVANNVKIAFIGSGGIVQSHLDQGLKEFEDVGFVGWCDLNEKTAEERRQRPDFFTIEDASMVQLSFANGAAGNLYSSCSTPVGRGIFLHIWATEMKAEFTGWEHSVRIELSGGEQISIPGEENIFAQEDRAFIDSVKAGKKKGILSTYEDGLKATAIACAANESMKTGKIVKINL